MPPNFALLGPSGGCRTRGRLQSGLEGWHRAGQSSLRPSCSSTFPGAALSAVFYSGSSVRPADSRTPALAAATRGWDGDSSVRALPRCSPAEAKSRAGAG